MGKRTSYQAIRKIIDHYKKVKVQPTEFLDQVKRAIPKGEDAIKVLFNYLTHLMNENYLKAKQIFDDLLFEIFSKNRREDLVIFFTMYFNNFSDLLWFDIVGTRMKLDPLLEATLPQRVHFLHFQKELFHIAQSDDSLLIVGETGTGKEIMAKVIHEMSKYRKKEIVAVNCSAIPRELLESTLFGAVKGAATGVKDSLGLIKTSEESTLFLDEIGRMDPFLQMKLLRFIEDRKFYRVGATKPTTVNCRIICACQPQQIEEGIISDLLYRLNYPFRIKMPNLAERLEKNAAILLLNALTNVTTKFGRSEYFAFSDKALEILKKHSYKGNYRELANILRTSVIIANAHDRDMIEPGDLYFIQDEESKHSTDDELETIPLKDIFIYADEQGRKLKATIIEKKVKQVKLSGRNFTTVLHEEGWKTSRVNFFNRVKQITGKTVNEICASG